MILNDDDEDETPKKENKPNEDKKDEMEERPFTFDFLKKEIRKAVEEEDKFDDNDTDDFEFELDEDDEQDIFDVPPRREERKDPIDIPALTKMDTQSKRVELMEQRRRREEMLNGAQKLDISVQDYRSKFEVPAYERKKVNFVQVPHSADRNISKFNLTEDSQILGNNKYLHDNVD